MKKELEKVKIISDVLKESCTNEELRWYLQDLIQKAKKKVFDELDNVRITIDGTVKLETFFDYKDIKRKHLVENH